MARIVVTNLRDTLNGIELGNRIFGLGGNDVIRSGAGSAIIDGNEGADMLLVD